MINNIEYPYENWDPREPAPNRWIKITYSFTCRDGTIKVYCACFPRTKAYIPSFIELYDTIEKQAAKGILLNPDDVYGFDLLKAKHDPNYIKQFRAYWRTQDSIENARLQEQRARDRKSAAIQRECVKNINELKKTQAQRKKIKTNKKIQRRRTALGILSAVSFNVIKNKK